MQVNGHFLPLEYSCCNLLHNCKDKLFTPAFGLFGDSVFKGHCKTFVFPPLLSSLHFWQNYKLFTTGQLASSRRIFSYMIRIIYY